MNMAEYKPTSPDEQFSREISREDARGKFLTIVDATDFGASFDYTYNVADGPKRTKEKRPPFNKVGLRLVVWEPADKKDSITHYMDVDDFLLLSNEIMARPVGTDGYGTTVFESVGFSAGSAGKPSIARELKVSAAAAKNRPGKVTFMFSFTFGPATMSEDGRGFNFTGDKTKLFIGLTEEQARKMFNYSSVLIGAKMAAYMTSGIIGNVSEE